MRNIFFARNCLWAAQWSWRNAPRQSGADIASNHCLVQANGNLEQAFSQAQRYSVALQNIPGVERAWARQPGVVYVVLEGAALLQLALDDYAMPWRAVTPGRWLLDYGAAVPFDEIGFTQARQGVQGDTLARLLTHAGHHVVRERLVFNDGNDAHLLTQLVQLHMQALETNVPFDHERTASALAANTSRRPGHLPCEQLMHSLADKALRMGVLASDAIAIGDFAMVTVLALQEESFAHFRVEFDNVLQTSQFREPIANVLAEWRNHGHTDVRDAAVVFHGSAFGGKRDIAAVKNNSDITYFTERVAHHVEQLRAGFASVVSLRDAGHEELASNARLGLEALQINHSRLSYFMVKPAQAFPMRNMRRKRHATLAEASKILGINGLRLGLLSANPNQILRFDTDHWVEQAQHFSRSMHDAFTKAHAAVEDHCEGIAAMQAGPIAHAAKPLVLALLRWPDCQRAAIETLNPTLVYRHAVELVRLVHKTHANVPMQELDGAGLAAMGTAWSLAASQLRTLLDVMGIDVLEWQPLAAD